MKHNETVNSLKDVIKALEMLGHLDRAQTTSVIDQLDSLKVIPSPDREDLIRQALEEVRTTEESGKAGAALRHIPKDVSSNWGWLQNQWPVVVAVDTVLNYLVVEEPREALELLESLRLDNRVTHEQYIQLFDAIKGAAS